MVFLSYTIDDYLKANPPKWWQIKRRLGIISPSDFFAWAGSQMAEKEMQELARAFGDLRNIDNVEVNETNGKDLR